MHGPPLRNPTRWLPGLLATLAATVRKAARTPLTRPRMTTRRMMMLVALMAIALWASMKVPRSLDFREMAERHAIMEGGFKEKAREGQARANHFQANLDRLHLDAKSRDEITESYLDTRLNFELADARYLSKMASHHAGLNRKYRRAMWLPWESLADDPPPPNDPLLAAPTRREGGKSYYLLRNGGEGVAYSPDGTMIAIGQTDGTVKLLEISSDRTRLLPGLPEARIHSLVFSVDGKTLAGAGDGKLFCLWDAATGRLEKTFPWVNGSEDGDFWSIMALAFSPDGMFIAVAAGGQDWGKKPPLTINSTRLYETRTGGVKWEHKGTGEWIHSVAFSPDGATVACDTGAAILLDSKTGEQTRTLKPLLSKVMAVAYSHDGRTVAGYGGSTTAIGVFSGIGHVTIWDARTGTVLQTLEGLLNRVENVAFSPDGKVVAGGGSGLPRKSWDAFHGSRVSKFVSEMSFWNLETGRLLRTVEGGSYPVRSMAFSPNGENFIYSDEDHVAIVDVQTGLLKRILQQAERKWVVHEHPAGETAFPKSSPRR